MPPKLGKTRLSSRDKRADFLGVSKDMAENDLPTLRACLRHGMYLREQFMLKGEELDVKDMAKEIYMKVTSLYFKANAKLIPPVIMSETVAVQKIVRSWSDTNTVIWKQKNNNIVKKRLEQQLEKLFDLIYCQCSISCVEVVTCSLSSCSHKKVMTCVKEATCSMDNCSHTEVMSCVKDIICNLASCSHKKIIPCVCTKEEKLPKMDLTFIRAQRMKVGETGAYQMGPVDKKETKKQSATAKNKALEMVREENKNERIRMREEEELEKKNEASNFMDEIPDVSADVNENDEAFTVESVDQGLKKSLQNRTTFPNVAAASLRYGASDRMTAAIATAALIDAGLITEEDSSQVLDHNKVHREKKKLMENLRTRADQRYMEEDIKCILFDGRKNWTNVMERDDETGKFYQRKVKMEFISVTNEPGGEYLFHFNPPEATKTVKAAKQIAIKIVEWIEKYGVESTLDSIGGDSTNINTGWEGGSFTLIEEMLGQKMTWLICYLHTNELPLRHLIQDLDGKTTSDNTFSGPLGKALDNVVNLDINPKFPPITIGEPLIDLEQHIVEDLSSDQKYAYKIVQAIRAGKVPVELANMDIGPVVHSRFQTTASRFCRLWVSVHGFKGKNLANMRCIVEFIIGVYFPMWFQAKVKHSFIEGPRHVLKKLELLTHQKKKIQNLVAPQIARGAWFSHSEAVLQTLLCSEDRDERNFAVNIILKVRNGAEKGDLTTRKRVHGDTFNPKAKKLIELCSWDSNVFEPVLTCPLSLEEIKEFRITPMVVPYRPVHGQSMERVVKEVTRACETVYGDDARDGFIRAGVANRQIMPKNNTKKHLARMAGN